MSPGGGAAIRDLPSALTRREEIADRLARGRPAIFLDYDGTLTPIVDDPAAALLPERARTVVERLARRCPVGVISGRDLDDLRRLVGVEGLFYAGSHGFDLLDPGGERHERATEARPALARAARELRRELEGVAGVALETKRFGLAIHVRRLADPDDEPRVEAAVDRMAEEEPALRKTGGKKVFELRPDLEWDKGRAVDWILDVVDPGGKAVVPLYVGDDLTDEDAFEVVGARGVTVVVRGEDDARRTAAEFALADPAAVRDFLESLDALLGAEDGTERPAAGSVG